MKVDMEAMVNKVRNEFNQKDDPAIEDALAKKTKRVFELEIKCRNLEDKVANLMCERDKLAEISSDLRADLNRCQRFVDEHLEHRSPQQKQPNHVVDYNVDIFGSMADREELKSPIDELKRKQASEIPPKDKQDSLLEYGKKITNLAI